MVHHQLFHRFHVLRPARLLITRRLCGLMLAVAAGLTVVEPVMAAADSPVVTPATGGNGVPVIVGNFDNLDAIGYRSAEFFLSGNAHSYTTTAALTQDGKWNAVIPSPDTAAYKTRVIVYTPKDSKRFNGTVYVEWLNVSGLADAAPDWVQGHIEVARQGAAYVLASVQSAGVTTLKSANPWWVPPVPYPVSDPVRYASLNHPGDSYSYDIYSQVGQAVRDGGLLGGLIAQRVIGLGQSQSAGRLTTYIDAVQALANVYDGFIVHSSFGRGALLSQPPQQRIPVNQTKIRDDLVPVLLFETETDVSNGKLQTRQPEQLNGNFRLWEVAGTAHYDSYGLQIGTTDTGSGEGEVADLQTLQNPSADPQPGLIDCAEGINAGPMHWVYNAALHWINRWVADGTPPPIAPRFQTQSLPGLPVVFKTDEHGNTLGGIRTPQVDVPVATLTGTGNQAAPNSTPTSTFCSLFGQTVPFGATELATLYPSHDAFVKQYWLSALNATLHGYLLWDDAINLVDAADSSTIGN